uniref:RoaA n=1 Tax=Trachelomonas volvocina TaxID=103340 RepID=A0A0G3VPV7_9EUGL|nr:RoaA [Trachelomonas volvocina]AKL82433.1 RoaA [Trachelomonas volvocina]
MLTSLVARCKALRDTLHFYDPCFFIPNINEKEKFSVIFKLGNVSDFQTMENFIVSKKKSLSYFFSDIDLLARCTETLICYSFLPISESTKEKISIDFKIYRTSHEIYLNLKRKFSKKFKNFWFICFNFSLEKKTQTWIKKNIPVQKNLLQILLKSSLSSNSERIKNITLYGNNTYLYLLNFLLNGLVKIFEFYLIRKHSRNLLKKDKKASKNSQFIHFLNSITIFTKNIESLKGLERILFEFFSIRNLKISEKRLIFNFKELNSGFNLLGINFYLSQSGSCLTKFSIDLIRLHKAKIKGIIKNSNNIDVASLILSINKIIIIWSAEYNCINSFWDVCGELDVYVYKLLWKWAKKRHPRRNNKWIYSKYWKVFLGNWKFFSYENNKGNIVYLRSHYFPNTSFHHLPLYTNLYDILDSTKLANSYFNKFKNLFSGIYRILWKKQNGCCFLCKKPFFFVTITSIKIWKIRGRNNFLANLVLVHNHCVH